MPINRIHRQLANRSRCGVSTVEAIAALAVMAVLLAFVGQWTTTMMKYRRGLERRRVAMQATENVISLAMASPYEELTGERLRELAEPLTPRRASWSLDVTTTAPESSEDLAKRIFVAVRFESATAFTPRPLVVWKYPTGHGGVDDEQ